MPEYNIIVAFLLGAICGIVFMDIFFGSQAEIPCDPGDIERIKEAKKVAVSVDN